MTGAATRPFPLSTAAEPTVFQQLLGAPFFNLPDSLRSLHSVRGQDAFAGEVDIERGRGLLARLCGWLVGMPPAMQQAPLRLELSADPGSETWRRHFGSHRMATRLRRRGGLLAERLGPLQFRFAVHAAEGTIYWNVARVSLLGLLPLPARLFGGMRVREWEQDGRYRFHVEVTLPLVGPVIAYHGWLEPAASSAD